MSLRRNTGRRFASGLPGLLLAVLALVSQLALGSVLLPDVASAQEQVAALTVLCDSSTAAPGQQPTHHRHSPDCALCPLCVALALPAMVVASGPDLPLPQVGAAQRATLPPPARGPPEQPRPAALPRGPPALT